MRGEDCQDGPPTRLEGHPEVNVPFHRPFLKAKPPLHQPILLPRRHPAAEGDKPEEVLDPLAVWCGEVVLLPKEAVDTVGLCSSFASASSLLSPAACAKARDLWQLWCKEFRALSNVEGSRVMAADMRVQPNNQILQKDTVWLSKKTWNKFSKMIAKGSTKTARWKLFLEEASAVRWGSASAQKGDEKEPKPGEATADEQADHPQDAGDQAKRRPEAALVSELLLYDGLLCDHGKVGKPKSGFLVPRDMLESVLRCAVAKEKAYKSLWGSCRGMQRFRTGHREHRLLASDEVCDICCAEWATNFANPNRNSRSGLNKPVETCTLVLGSDSATDAAPHILEVPWEDGRTITGSWLRKLVVAQVGSEVAELYAGAAGGEQRLLQDDDVMDFLPPNLRAHLRSETPAEPEGDAFLRSVLRGARPR